MLGPVGLTAQVAHPDPSYGILAAGISWSTIPEAARLGLTPSAKFALSYYGGRFSKLIGSAFGSVFGAAFMISDLVGPGGVVAFREEMLITALKDMGMVYSTVERGLDEQTYLSTEACGRLRMDQLNDKLRGVERGLEEMVNEFNMSNIKLDQEGFLDNSGKQERFRKFYEANKSRYLDRWKEDWNSDKD